MRILPYFVRKHLSLIQVYPSTELDQTIMKQIISLQDRISDYHHQTWKDRHHRRRVEGHRVDGGVSLAACPTTGSGWWWCWVAEGRVEMAWAVELVTEWDVYGCRFLEVVYMYIYIYRICSQSFISFDFGSIQKGPHRFEPSFEFLAVEPH